MKIPQKFYYPFSLLHLCITNNMEEQLKNNINNDSRSFIGKLLFGSRMATIFIYVVLICLCVEMAMSQEVTPVKIGNPTLARWPASGDSTALNGDRWARPRSVWDMYYFNGRIYIGSGDYWANSGPTDVWTYNGTGFVKEYTVDDEIIFNFFEYDNKLFIPGNDATEDWSFGNLYINDPNRIPNPGWIKLRTLSGCLHSWCVALFQDKLYANITTDGSTPNRILVSSDMGQSWTDFIVKYGDFLVFPHFLFIHAPTWVEGIGWVDYIYKYDGTTIQNITSLDLHPDWTGRKTKGRLIQYRDGALYTPFLQWMLDNPPLFFLPASEIKNGGTATKIAQFATDNVRDIVIRDTTCYVMTAEEITCDVSYKGHIYSSTDLTNWSQVTEFIVPGIPLSFEIMNNKFYVGLCARWDTSLALEVAWDFLVGPESGSIWEIDAAPSNVEISINTIPTGYSLSQNFPNPFNSSTSISFGLQTKSYVSLKVFDVIGREMATLVSEELPQGKHSVLWNAMDMPSGVYIYRLQAGSFTATKKLILLK